MKSGKRVLITGGAGFIGSHLCRYYLDKEWHVTCVDNLFTGFEQNIAELKSHPQFVFIKHDIIEPLTGEFDLILNFACPASPVHYQLDPIYTLKTSVIGTLNLLELAKKNKARFLQASTSEVYGDPEQHPQPETYTGRVNPIGIRACYDEGKRAAETLCFDFLRFHKLDVRVIRIFNTYGPNMREDDGRVVSNFIVQALQNKPITIYGTGKQTRSFCFVSDLVEGITRVAAAPAELISGPYNLGRDEEYNVTELAQKIIALTKSKSEIVHHPLPSDDPTVRRPDLTKTSKTFDWKPKVPLEQGLIEAIAYFKKVINK